MEKISLGRVRQSKLQCLILSWVHVGFTANSTVCCQRMFQSDVSRVQSLPGVISDYVHDDVSEKASSIENADNDKDNCEILSGNESKSDDQPSDSEGGGRKEHERETATEEVEPLEDETLKDEQPDDEEGGVEGDEKASSKIQVRMLKRKFSNFFNM